MIEPSAFVTGRVPIRANTEYIAVSSPRVVELTDVECTVRPNRCQVAICPADARDVHHAGWGAADARRPTVTGNRTVIVVAEQGIGCAAIAKRQPIGVMRRCELG